MSDTTHDTFTCPYCGHRQRYMSDEAPDSCCPEREQAEQEARRREQNEYNAEGMER